MDENALRADIEKLDLRPGDIIVVRMPNWHSAAVERAQHVLKEALPPDVKALVLASDVELSVQRKGLTI